MKEGEGPASLTQISESDPALEPHKVCNN